MLDTKWRLDRDEEPNLHFSTRDWWDSNPLPGLRQRAALSNELQPQTQKVPLSQFLEFSKPPKCGRSDPVENDKVGLLRQRVALQKAQVSILSLLSFMFSSSGSA